MMFGFAVFLIAAAFGIQLVLCFRAKRTWVKLLPAITIALGEVVCGAAYGISLYLEHLGKGIYGAAFAAVIYGAVLLMVLIGDGLAWGAYGLTHFSRKRNP